MAPLGDPALLALAIALSLFVGTLMGVIGGGGGFVYVFMLIVLFGVDPATAVGTGLLLATIGAASAVLSHRRQGHLRPAIAGRMAVAGTLAGFAGGTVATAIPEDVLRWLVIVLFVVLGAQPFLTRRRDTEASQARPLSRGESAGVAAGVGLGVGAFGISGGAPLSSYLAGRLGLEAATAVGTAMLVVVAMSVAGAAAHLSFGTVSASWLAVLGVGAAVGSWLGAGLTRRIDERALAITLGVLTIATSVGLAVGI